MEHVVAESGQIGDDRQSAAYSRGAVDRTLDAVLGVGITSIVGPDHDAVALAQQLEIEYRSSGSAGSMTVGTTALEPAVGGLHQIVIGPCPVADLVISVGGDGEPVIYARLKSIDAGRRPTARMEVAILGPTEIRGVDAILRGRPVLTELVVYLALHPEGAVTRTWSAALWPDRHVPAQTISNRLSEARQLLGFAPDDRPRLRRDGDRHTIADVATDWEQFRELADEANGPEAWRAALTLVRGRPLLDLAQGQWAVMEGIVAEIEQGVVECALGLGRVLLRDGDADGAAWAAQMALRCTPWDERLHRLLMRAADAAGNRQGVEAALRHLALVLEIDGDPLGRVHPQTAALYARLANLSTPAAR